MRTSRIKNRLNDEMDALAPERKVVQKERPVMAKMNTGKKFSIIAASLVLVVALSVGGIMLFGNKGGTAHAETYVCLDINPSVEFALDKKNKVVTFSAGNQDGEVILYALSKDGIDLTGKSIEAASENIIKMAIKYGYVEDGVNELNVTIEGANKTEKIETTVRALVEKGVNKAKGGMEIVISDTVDYLLAHELAELKANNADNANYQGLTASKLRLVKSVRMADRRISMDDAVAMTVEQLTTLAQANQQNAKEKINTACDIAIMSARYAMDNVLGVWYDTAYNQVIGFDIARQIHAIAYTTVNPVLRAIEHTEALINAYNANPIFTKEDALNFLNAVGVANVDEKYETLKSDMTKYTDMSLQNLQKHIKDLSMQLRKVADGSEQYKNIEAKLQFAVTLNDQLVEDSEKIISISGEEWIIEIQENLSKLADKMDGLVVPQNTAELKEMTIATFHNMVVEAGKIRQTMFDAMKLTEDEKTAVKGIIEDREAEVDAIRVKFNNAVDAAKKDANAFLDKILNTRLVVDIK